MNGHATINRLYRLVWSEAQGAWVAVAENTRGRGKSGGRRKLLAALFAGLGAGALAHAGAPAPNQLPTGGQVTGGEVHIDQQGNRMTIDQASQRGAIDWQTFNIGNAAEVRFQQPSNSAVTLNRVLDTQASQIHGRISSNGQVFLSNPNGVYFSPTASADVGALVATTGAMSSADFMAGSNIFERNGTAGSVVNEGVLNAGLHGYIALLAPEVRNAGLIVAQAGTVALAGGEAISLQFDERQSLVGVLVTPARIDTLVENRQAVRAPGGTIIMSAQAARELQDGVVRNSGTLEATGLSSIGGKIVLDSAGLVDNAGSVNASGTRGGTVDVKAGRMLSSGALLADGTVAGGHIATQADSVMETSGAQVSAKGGGTITVDSGAGQLFSSGKYDVSGAGRGGDVILSGAKVALMGASVDASGDLGGGSIRIGGGFQGLDAGVRNTGDTRIGKGVELRADARRSGDGGQVAVWSDGDTRFAGHVSAIGGEAGGNGGQIEVSGKQNLYFAGSGDAHAAHGSAGTMLLDPRDIYIDADLTGQKEFLDPHPTVGGTFGTLAVPLSTKSGNVTTSTDYVVVTNPTDNLGAANAGAVYLFRASDQALVSTLYGTHSGDKVGSSGVTALSNGNFLVGSNLWDNGKGALTWGHGATGWGNGATAVSSANSLVGSSGVFTNSQGYQASDGVGSSSQIKQLANGNYLVANSGWNNNRGAVTFGDAASGVSGVIGAANSLVGSTPNTNTAAGGSILYKYGDQIGSSVQLLGNGNYAVVAAGWNMGVGALALGNGTTGISGAVGAANSLVGDSSRSDATGYGINTDKIGWGFQSLDDTRFIIASNYWNNSAGAVTSFDGVTAPTGLVSAANSLVGGANDNLSSGGISVLESKNAFVINSPNWNSSRGAITWVPFASNVKDVSVATSGITGSAVGDAVGSRGVNVLANQDYVVSSPSFNGARGAATLVDGATGRTAVGQSGIVAAANSLVGSNTGDQVAANGTLALTGNGNFLVLSPYWANGAATVAGAVTWSSGVTPTIGAVTTANSLVGSATNDRVGAFKYTYYNYYDPTPYQQEGSSVTALANGNFAIASPMWNGKRGAVTWGNGATGASATGFGAISASNSLVGSSVNDHVGGFLTPNDPIIDFNTNATMHYDAIGNGITALANGNFVVSSNYWNNGAAARAGAVSWNEGNGAATVGAVSSANSLVGSSTDDMVGTGKSRANGIAQLQSGYDANGKITYSGNYVVTNASWNNGALSDAGAVTWGAGNGPLAGAIANTNSVLGLKANDIANWTVTPLANNGNYLVINSYWTNGAAANAGAVSWVDGSSGQLRDYAANGNRNVVSAANSLVGVRAGDRVGNSMSYLTRFDPLSGVNELTGNYVVRSTIWANGNLANAGAVTWGNGLSGVSGTIDSTNSIIGIKAGDAVGATYLQLSNGDYVVANKNADIGGVVNAGAAGLVDGDTGRLGDYAARGNQNILSAANALVGSHLDDKVGTALLASANYGPRDLSRPGYFVVSTQWNCMAGAVTYVDDAGNPVIGVVGPANSAVGNPNETFFGGLLSAPKIGLDTNEVAYVTFGGGTGHVLLSTGQMPSAPAVLLPGATAYGDAEGALQAMTPDYVSAILRTGTSLSLQANNDIFIKSAIDASGGAAGGALTLRAGRSITVLGDIVTGDRDLTIIANDTLANGVKDAYRADGIATISMGKNPQGAASRIDAGTGAVSINMLAGADKTYTKGGSISLNNVSGSTVTVVNQGNGLGTNANLPALGGNCCGYDLGYRGAGADIVLNTGALITATGAGTAVTLAADGKFTNLSGRGAGTIATTDPAARWLVYSSSPATSSFGNLDSGNTAVWNASYTGAPVAPSGNRYLFKYQPSVVVNTQDVTKTYGQDLSATLGTGVLSLSGAQPGVAGAFLADTVASAISGSAVVASSGAGAGAAASATPYAVSVDLSGISGNNGYAVVLGSATPRTLTVNRKALTASLNAQSKVYDGSTGVALDDADFLLGGLVNGEMLAVANVNGNFNLAGVGASAVSASLQDSDFSGVNGALASNYILPTFASGSGTVTPKALSAGVSTSKVYDGGAGAVLASGDFVLTGFVGAESASITQTTGAFDSAGVAGATSVSAILGAGDFRAADGTDLANYVLPALASGSGSISARQLQLALTGTLGKTYDGSASATLTGANYTLTGFVGGQSASVTQTAGSYDSVSAANASQVSVSLGAGDYQATAGTDLSNYVLPTAASAATSISRAALTVSANHAGKTYDRVAYSGGNGITVSGLQGNDTVAGLGTVSYGGTAQGAVNAGTYAITASGLNSADYAISYVDGVLTIDPRALSPVTATLVGNFGKTYDGSNTATLDGSNFSLAGFLAGDGASVGTVLGQYDSANAGLRSVTANLGIADFTPHDGTLLSNYVLPASVTGSASIAPRALALSLAGSFGKTYDGNTSATLTGANYTLTGFVGGQSASVTRIAGSYDSASAANASQVSVSLGAGDYQAGAGTDLSNYVLPTAASAPAAIARAALTVSTNDAGKTYDRVAYSGGNGITVSGLQGNDTVAGLGTVAYGGTAQGAVNAGTYAITASGLNSADYAISYVDGSLTIAPRTLSPVTVGLVGNLGKTYDGSTVASLAPANFSLAGFVGGDGASVIRAVGQYDSRNAGTRTVSVDLTAADFLPTEGTLLSNYVLPTSASGSAVITPKSVTLNAPAVSKIYDGGTAYSAGSADLAALGAGLVEGDQIVGATLRFSDKNAGAGNRTVHLSNAVIDDGNGGANYQVTLADSHMGSIAPRLLQVGATGIDRTYDATANAAVTLSDDRVEGDQLDIGIAGASFADKNAGTAKTIQVNGIALGGADSGNYTVANTSTQTSASIARARVAVTGVLAVGRTYDTSTEVALRGTAQVQAFGDDVVVVTGAGRATMADKNAGRGKTVTVSGYAADDANYELLQPSGLTVDIAQAVLALQGLGTAGAKTYDGSRSVTLTGTARVTGLNGEIVSVGGNGSGQFADKNVGNGKAITVSGFVADDGNYLIGQQAGLVGEVAPAQLAVQGLRAQSKEFDGKHDATLEGIARIEPVAGDAVSLGGTAEASFADAEVGIGKAVSVSGYKLAGADAANYVLTQPRGLSASIGAPPTVPAPVVLPAQALPAPPATLQLEAPLAFELPQQQAAVPVAARRTGGITVSLVRETAREQSGRVAVSVPKEMAQSASGFSFPLPSQLVDQAALSREQVKATTTSGTPLPAWLRYDNASKTFSATTPPAGSLPYQVLLTIGVEQAVIVISERSE